MFSCQGANNSFLCGTSRGEPISGNWFHVPDLQGQYCSAWVRVAHGNAENTIRDSVDARSKRDGFIHDALHHGGIEEQVEAVSSVFCGRNADRLCAKLQLLAGSGWIERDSKPGIVVGREREVEFLPVEFDFALSGSIGQCEFPQGFAALRVRLCFRV